MKIGERVKTLDGSVAIIVSLNGGAARVCYLAPGDRLSYIAETHLLIHLRPAPGKAAPSLAA